MAMSGEVHVVDSPDAGGALAARLILDEAHKAMAARGRFVIGWSGGSIPGVIGGALLNALGADHDCSRWFIVFVDERCVPRTDPESNYRAVEESFLRKAKGIDRRHVLIPDQNTFDPVGYEKVIENALGSGWCLDVALLGMGPDGHTASLFPGRDQEMASTVDVIAVHNSPKPPPHRLTLTLTCLNRSQRVIFFACSASKRDALKLIFSGDHTLPASRVQSKQLDWIIDEEANPQ